VISAYLDASALVKLILEERETDALRRFLEQRPIRFTNRVAQVEVTRAIHRLPDGAAAQVVEAFTGVRILELDADLAARAAAVGPTGLRSLDAIHLASALLLGDELDAFVTYDARQAEAARAEGLSVESPA
jgi:predicted nucleic acid-binding protein